MNKSKLREQIKKKTILTFYTRVAGGDVVLESQVLDRIDQSKDIYELKIHVKMPAKETKEFREALSTIATKSAKEERNRVLDEVLMTIGNLEKEVLDADVFGHWGESHRAVRSYSVTEAIYEARKRIMSLSKPKEKENK